MYFWASVNYCPSLFCWFAPKCFLLVWALPIRCLFDRSRLAFMSTCMIWARTTPELRWYWNSHYLFYDVLLLTKRSPARCNERPRFLHGLAAPHTYSFPNVEIGSSCVPHTYSLMKDAEVVKLGSYSSLYVTMKDFTSGFYKRLLHNQRFSVNYRIEVQNSHFKSFQKQGWKAYSFHVEVDIVEEIKTPY